MKKAYLLFLTLFFASQFSQAGTSRNWELLTTHEGIEFYTSTTGNAEHQKTLLKVKNTNDFEARISFSAVFPCSETEKKTQSEVIFVATNGMVIYTYEVCSIDKNKNFELKEINVAEQ